VEQQWTSAQQSCRSWGGELASITTAEDFAEIKRYLAVKDPSHTHKYWIGLDDRRTEGIWEWTDRSPLGDNSFTAWAPGEPNNHLLFEDCGVLAGDRSRRWHDSKCFYWHRYICKRDTKVDGITMRIVAPPVAPPKPVEPEPPVVEPPTPVKPMKPEEPEEPEEPVEPPEEPKEPVKPPKPEPKKPEPKEEPKEKEIEVIRLKDEFIMSERKRKARE